MEADETRASRIARLCLLCIGNIATYRSAWALNDQARERLFRDAFWLRSTANALDMAVIDWCKVFNDWRSRHTWHTVITEATSFKRSMYASVGMSPAEFGAELRAIKAYRDKHVAHLDDPLPLFYPRTEPMLATSSLLYDQLVAMDGAQGFAAVAPKGAAAFLADMRKDADAKHAVAVRDAVDWLMDHEG